MASCFGSTDFSLCAFSFGFASVRSKTNIPIPKQVRTHFNLCAFSLDLHLHVQKSHKREGYLLSVQEEEGREEGRMWVFIRPGVVRSAKEKNVKLAHLFCPIHPFDATYPFL